MESKNTVSDFQLSGLVDIVIAQHKDILDLHSSVVALLKLAKDIGGAEEVNSRFGDYKQEYASMEAFDLARTTIERLEAWSIQLKQSGEAIQ